MFMQICSNMTKTMLNLGSVSLKTTHPVEYECLLPTVQWLDDLQWFNCCQCGHPLMSLFQKTEFCNANSCQKAMHNYAWHHPPQKTLGMCNQKISKVKTRIFTNDIKHGTDNVPVWQINSSVALEQGSILPKLLIHSSSGCLL